jgi:hypothetical protein
LPFLRLQAWTALALAAALLCATTAVASAQSTLDQAQDRSWEVGAPISARAGVFVQMFTAGLTGRLDRIEIPLYVHDTPGDLMIDVRATGGGYIGQGGEWRPVTMGLPARCSAVSANPRRASARGVLDR